MFHIRKAPSSRQQVREQTKTLPGSNVTGRLQKNFELPRSQNAPSERSHQRKPKSRENVKFDESNWKQLLSSGKNFELYNRSTRQKELSKPKHPLVFRNQAFNENNSVTEVDSESALSGNESESENESEFPSTDDFQQSFECIDKNLEKISDDLLKVKSQLSANARKWKSQEKINQPSKFPKRKQENGAGDTQSKQNESIYNRMNQVKKDCYRKIEANLELLKNIDIVNDQMLKNHMSFENWISLALMKPN